MVSFARASTRSWLARLWPATVQPIMDDTVDLDKSKKIIDNIAEQNKFFLETSKNGGMWFS